MEDEVKKAHKAPHSGRKAEKKKAKVKKQEQNLTARQRNPKAFAINSVNKAANKFRHAQDLETRKQHQPKVDRTPLEPPPYVVAIIGPPGVGKSTLLRCLIRHYTGQKLASLHGPITLVSNKKCRLTFMEIGCDINSLIDIAKVVDLALLFIHAKHGLDLETMEFLTICREVGMPKVLAVLTHLDTLPHKAAIKKAKDTIKKRYGQEIQKGAKIFYFSRFNGEEYPKLEVRNLARFISNIKVRPIQWRVHHPYILVDRMEDITDLKQVRANQNCNRKVSFYGYLRGSFLKKGHSVHIAGVGDYTISDVDFVADDPCPLPDVIKKRSLTLKERNIYSHWSGLGGIMYDKDAVYIHKPQGYQKSKNTFTSMFKQVLDEGKDSEEEQQDSEQESEPNEEEEDDACSEKSYQSENENFLSDNEDGQENEKLVFDDDESENGEENRNFVFDDDESENEEDAFLGNAEDSEDELEEDEEENSEDDEGIVAKRKHVEDSDDEEMEMPSKKPCIESDDEELIQHDDAKNIALIKKEIGKNEKAKKKMAIEEDIFIKTSNVVKPVVDSLTQVTTTEEDLTGLWVSEDVLAEEAKAMLGQQELKKDSEEEDSEEDEKEEHSEGDEKEEDSEEDEEEEDQKKKSLEEKKLKTKRQFHLFLDNKETYYEQLKEKMEEQAQLNKSTFEGIPDMERVEYEGYRPGMYVRMVVEDMPVEFVNHFDPDHPLIVGGLKAEESIMTYVNLKIKSHRWYCRILKTDDPLILSMGWRRFQTIPVFYTLDDNGRQRRLKYTHKYIYCQAVTWAPYTPTGTGVIGLQTVSGRDGTFRIAATGEVTGSTETPEVVKKLKLLGYPKKIFKKTAFIEGMFNSELEVAKFEGALIKTQSGLRGIIKKAVKSFKDEQFPEGTFRCSFEDKILMSDIVFMTTWVKLDIERFYFPVLSILLKDKTSWQGMKTVGKLRFERGLKAKQNPDSIYTPVEHPQRIYPEIKIPNHLQRQLPYRIKPKFDAKAEKKNSLQRIAVIREKNEKEVADLLKKLQTLSNAKERQELKARIESIKKHRRKVQLANALKKQKEKEKKKEAMWKMNANKKK